MIDKLDKRSEKKKSKSRGSTFHSHPRVVRSPSKATPSRTAPQWAVDRAYWTALESPSETRQSSLVQSSLVQSSVVPSSSTLSSLHSTPTTHSSCSQRMLTFDTVSPVENTIQDHSDSDSGDSDSEFQV